MSNSKTSKVRFSIKLDDNNIPQDISWIASDSNNKESNKSKSLFAFMWDPEEKNTVSLNLWTKEMQMDEMHVHFYQCLMTMAESLEQATGTKFAVEEMKKFCDEFDKKVKATYEGNEQ